MSKIKAANKTQEWGRHSIACALMQTRRYLMCKGLLTFLSHVRTRPAGSWAVSWPRWRAFHRTTQVGKTSEIESSLWPNTIKPWPWVLYLKASRDSDCTTCAVEEILSWTEPCEVNSVPLEQFICPRGGSWMESSLLNSAFKCTQSRSRVPIQSQTQFSMAMGKTLQLFQSTQVRKPNPDNDAALLSQKWINTQRPLCSLQWTSFTLSRYFWLSSDFRMWLYMKRSERIISILT